MITLKRTFHPVGHGAFYTERFYEDGNCVYTAVYDCGCNAPVKNKLQQIVNAEFLQNTRINALFISHFDTDHINGIQYLLNYCDKIYVPALSPLEKITVYVYNCLVSGHINSYANRGLQKLFGDSEIGERIIEVEPFNRLENTVENEQDGTISRSGMLPAGTPISAGAAIPHWIYLPFYLKMPISITAPIQRTFASAINGNIVDFNEVARIIKVNGIPAIKQLFDSAIPANKRNFYSMTVYSGYEKGICCDECRCIMNNNCCGCRVDCKAKANCLYMGDFEASYKNVSDLTSFYKCYFFRSKIIQVPHHGSSSIGSVYDYGLYNHCNIGVISKGNGNSVSATNVINQLLQRRVTPVIVDSNPLSRYIMNFNI